eukprot:1941884-Prymnesium_polylepis.2
MSPAVCKLRRQMPSGLQAPPSDCSIAPPATPGAMPSAVKQSTTITSKRRASFCSHASPSSVCSRQAAKSRRYATPSATVAVQRPSRLNPNHCCAAASTSGSSSMQCVLAAVSWCSTRGMIPPPRPMCSVYCCCSSCSCCCPLSDQSEASAKSTTYWTHSSRSGQSETRPSESRAASVWLMVPRHRARAPAPSTTVSSAPVTEHRSIATTSRSFVGAGAPPGSSR